MNTYKLLKAVAWFLFFLALGAMIPDLTIEWFNFRQFSLEVKMILVFAAGIMGLAKLVLVLEEAVK